MYFSRLEEVLIPDFLVWLAGVEGPGFWYSVSWEPGFACHKIVINERIVGGGGDFTL